MRPRARISVRQLIPVVNAYYAKPGNGVGGSLHIVLDDGNLSRRDLEFCYDWALDQGDTDGMALVMILMCLSKSQLRRLYHWPRIRR